MYIPVFSLRSEFWRTGGSKLSNTGKGSCGDKIVDNFYPSEFEYASLDLLDAPAAELPIDEILDFLSKEKDGARIFVHCNAGVSR